MIVSHRPRRLWVLLLTLVLPLLLLIVSLNQINPLQAEPVAPFDVIINEWSQGNGGNKEWVELLVVTGPADLRGWDLGDDSAGDLTFSSHPLWANLPAGTLIIIYNGGDPDTILPPDDTDPSDYVLIIPHSNATYFTGVWPAFANTTTSDNPHLRHAADGTIHNFSTDPGATRHPEANECTYFTSNTASGVSSETNWANDGSALTCSPGLGNGGDNTTWINDLRGGGSGPELLAAKTGPAGAAAGDTITYTLAIDNVGAAAASGVTVTDTLPAGVNYLSYTSNQAVTLIDPTEPTLVWSVGTVISQTTLVITMQVVLPVSAVGVITNTLAVTTTTPGDNPNNNQATATTTILIPGMTLNEIHADPSATAGDANGDGIIDSADDEFIELVNNSGQMMDLSLWVMQDNVSTRHTFPAGTLLMPGCALLVFGGGTPTGTFGGSVVQVASEGSLGLNNTGDTITLYDDLGVAAATYVFGSEGGDDQSLVRSPDVVGPEPFLKHTVAWFVRDPLFARSSGQQHRLQQQLHHPHNGHNHPGHSRDGDALNDAGATGGDARGGCGFL